MLMKNIYYFMLVLLLSCTTSCKKILDKEPLDFYADVAESYNTAEKLESNILGVYTVLQDGALYGSQMMYLLGFEADEGYYARENPDGPHVNNFSTGNSKVYNFWTSLYKGIGRANALLANVDTNPEIDQKFRDKIRGEALFLRAYYYFMLVQNFNGVPLRLQPIESVYDVDKAKSTPKEVYEQIIKDMEKAEGLVPGIKSLGFGGRISKSAVRGILARVCLHMAGYPVKDVSKYAEASKWAKMVMDDSEAGHALNPSFSQIFINYAQDKYDIKESIWEIEFMGNATGAYTETGGVGYLNGPASSNTTIGEGFGGVKVTSKLFKSYELNYTVASAVGDLRRDWTIANFKHATSGSKTFITSVTPVNLYDRHCGKFRREFETLTPKHRTQTPQNFPLLRYADVLLMFAEAETAASGAAPSNAAIEAVELVRRRGLAIGGIKDFGLNAAGSGYKSAPKVTPTSGGGSGASIKAAVSTAGAITGFTLDMDPVTGVKMGKDYVGSGLYVDIVPTNGGIGGRANARIWQGDAANLNTTQKSSSENFIDFIKTERMRELAFETLRKGDLMRWGDFVFEMQAVSNHISSSNLTDRFYYPPYKNATVKYTLWPIPAKEMNLNNLMVQNPYW